MKATDIYALFGNAIDNAIEAVLRLDKEKRNISFSVKSHKNMIILHVENPFDGEIRMKNGLPLTRKEDTLSHGYGTLSMKVVAEKYGGTFSIDVRERIFSLNVIFMNHGNNKTDDSFIRNI